MSWLHSCRLPGPLTVLLRSKRHGDKWRCRKCKLVWTLKEHGDGWEWSA